MTGSYTPSVTTRSNVLAAVRSFAELGEPMPKPAALAQAMGRSVSTIRAAIGSLHDAGAFTIRHKGRRLVVHFPDGTKTA